MAEGISPPMPPWVPDIYLMLETGWTERDLAENISAWTRQRMIAYLEAKAMAKARESRNDEYENQQKPSQGSPSRYSPRF